MKKVVINISNKATYSLLSLVIIILVAVSVFAYNSYPGNPSVFGHSANEIEGVCKPVEIENVRGGISTEWVNCPNPHFQADLGLYINDEGLLCYPTGSATGCELEEAYCSSTKIYYVESNDACSLNLHSQNQICETECSERIACNGDVTGYTCGATLATYNSGEVLDCLSPPEGGDIIKCECSVAGIPYNSEIPVGDVRCV